MEVWRGENDDEAEELTDMLKVVLEAASEPSGLLPLLLIIVAALALVSAIFLLRYKRKGGK